MKQADCRDFLHSGCVWDFKDRLIGYLVTKCYRKLGVEKREQGVRDCVNSYVNSNQEKEKKKREEKRKRKITLGYIPSETTMLKFV